MKKLLLLLSLFLIGINAYSQCGNRVAYIRAQNSSNPNFGPGPEPWSRPDNINAMNQTFGLGNWNLLIFETLNPVFVFTGGHYSFIFIDGGDGGALELKTFLTANLAYLESFVANGGSLFLNAAPNEGGDINFGFGGVTLKYADFTACGIAANPIHPIFNGPATTSGATHFTGGWLGHAILCPPSMAPNVLIDDVADGSDVLVELKYGAGTVIFGGLTVPSFQCGRTGCGGSCDNSAPHNLRSNTLHYLVVKSTLACHPIPTMGEWGLINFGLLILSLCSIFIGARQYTMRTIDNQTTYQINYFDFIKNTFDGIQFIKLFVGACGVGLFVLFISIRIFGYELTTADIPGGLIASAIISYLIQLAINSNRLK